VQADGKIVAVGRSGVAGGAFALVRYLPQGTLDDSFGGDGIVITDFTPGNDVAQGVAIQDDGKVVVAGKADDTFAVARYRTTGALDMTFAGDGTRQTSFTSLRDVGSSLAIQPDGKIVVAGTAGIGPAEPFDSTYAVARYTTGGVLDPAFDGDGRATFDFSSFEDFGGAVAIQPAGEILVAGTAYLGAIDPDSRLGVVRFLSDGSLDSSFSDDAATERNPTSRPDLGHAIAIQPDGKIVVAGTSMSIASCCASRAVVVRLTAKGRPDDTFSGDTVVTDSADAQGANDMVIQPNGRIVVAGRAGAEESTFALFRLLAA
jgi:uncharacterized delta-60 repeat protein